MSEKQKYEGAGLIEAIALLKKNFILLVVVFLIFISAAGIITYFFVPKTYQSSISFHLQRKTGWPAIYLEAGLPEGDTEAKLCREIVLSRSFLKKILEEQGIAATTDNVALLREMVSVKQNDSGTLQIEVCWTEPETAYELTERIFNKYKEIVEEHINTVNRSTQKFIEEQIEKSLVRLTHAEEAVANYKKGLLTSPEEDMLLYNRLVREQKVAEEIYILLVSQLELAKIEQEKADKVVIWVIDPPEIPQSKHSPSLGRNMAIAGLLALLLGVLWVLLKEYLRKPILNHF